MNKYELLSIISDPLKYDREIRIYTEKYGGYDKSKKIDPLEDGIFLEIVDPLSGVKREFGENDYIRLREFSTPTNLSKTVDRNLIKLKKKGLRANWPITNGTNYIDMEKATITYLIADTYRYYSGLKKRNIIFDNKTYIQDHDSIANAKIYSAGLFDPSTQQEYPFYNSGCGVVVKSHNKGSEVFDFNSIMGINKIINKEYVTIDFLNTFDGLIGRGKDKVLREVFIAINNYGPLTLRNRETASFLWYKDLFTTITHKGVNYRFFNINVINDAVLVCHHSGRIVGRFYISNENNVKQLKFTIIPKDDEKIGVTPLSHGYFYSEIIDRRFIKNIVTNEEDKFISVKKITIPKMYAPLSKCVTKATDENCFLYNINSKKMIFLRYDIDKLKAPLNQLTLVISQKNIDSNLITVLINNLMKIKDLCYDLKYIYEIKIFYWNQYNNDEKSNNVIKQWLNKVEDNIFRIAIELSYNKPTAPNQFEIRLLINVKDKGTTKGGRKITLIAPEWLIKIFYPLISAFNLNVSTYRTVTKKEKNEYMLAINEWKKKYDSLPDDHSNKYKTSEINQMLNDLFVYRNSNSNSSITRDILKLFSSINESGIKGSIEGIRWMYQPIKLFTISDDTIPTGHTWPLETIQKYDTIDGNILDLAQIIPGFSTIEGMLSNIRADHSDNFILRRYAMTSESNMLSSGDTTSIPIIYDKKNSIFFDQQASEWSQVDSHRKKILEDNLDKPNKFIPNISNINVKTFNDIVSELENNKTYELDMGIPSRVVSNIMTEDEIKVFTTSLETNNNLPNNAKLSLYSEITDDKYYFDLELNRYIGYPHFTDISFLKKRNVGTSTDEYYKDVIIDKTSIQKIRNNYSSKYIYYYFSYLNGSIPRQTLDRIVTENLPIKNITMDIFLEKELNSKNNEIIKKTCVIKSKLSSTHNIDNADFTVSLGNSNELRDLIESDAEKYLMKISKLSFPVSFKSPGLIKPKRIYIECKNISERKYYVDNVLTNIIADLSMEPTDYRNTGYEIKIVDFDSPFVTGSSSVYSTIYNIDEFGKLHFRLLDEKMKKLEFNIQTVPVEITLDIFSIINIKNDRTPINRLYENDRLNNPMLI